LNSGGSRRNFLSNAGVLSAVGVIGPSLRLSLGAASRFADETAAEYTVRIQAIVDWASRSRDAGELLPLPKEFRQHTLHPFR
jgi:hypothetical protein